MCTKCEMSAGWFHLQCLRMKEGVGVLVGRAFVCCFRLSEKVLELTKLVGELWGEMIELRESVEVLSKENDDLVKRVNGRGLKLERKGRVVEMRKKPVCAISAAYPGGRQSEHEERADRERLQGGESRSGESPSLPVKKNKHGEYGRVRKLWVTRKQMSVEEVKEHLGEKFHEAEKVQVVRVCKEDNGKAWW